MKEIEKFIQLFKSARFSEIFTLVDYGNLNGLDGDSLNRIYQVFSERFSIITDKDTVKIVKYFADKGVLLATNDLMEHQLSEEYYEELINDPEERYEYYEELKSEFAGNNYDERIEETKKSKKIEDNEITGELPYSDYELAENYEEISGEMLYSDYDLAENYDELEEEKQSISPLYNLEKFTDDVKHMTFSELTTCIYFIKETIEVNFLTLLEQVDKLPESHKLDAFNILFKFVKHIDNDNYELLTDHFLILLNLSKKIMTYDQQCQFLSRFLIFEFFIESLVDQYFDQIESQIRTIIDNIDEIPEIFRYRALVHLIPFVSVDARLTREFSSSLLKCINNLSEREERKIFLRQLFTKRDLPHFILD